MNTVPCVMYTHNGGCLIPITVCIGYHCVCSCNDLYTFIQVGVSL